MIRSSKSSACASRSRCWYSVYASATPRWCGPAALAVNVAGSISSFLRFDTSAASDRAEYRFGIEVELAGDQLHEPTRVVCVVDREARLQAGVLVLGPQDAHARRVERGDPHEPGPVAHQVGDPLLHLAGGLVGERDRQDLARVHVALGEQVRDAVGEHPRLARAGAGHDEQRRTGMGDRLRAARRLRPLSSTASRVGLPGSRLAGRATSKTSGDEEAFVRSDSSAHPGFEPSISGWTLARLEHGVAYLPT